jgi:hypothetical protein
MERPIGLWAVEAVLGLFLLSAVLGFVSAAASFSGLMDLVVVLVSLAAMAVVGKAMHGLYEGKRRAIYIGAGYLAVAAVIFYLAVYPTVPVAMAETALVIGVLVPLVTAAYLIVRREELVLG